METEHALNRPIQVMIYAPIIGRGGVRRLVERLLGTWIQQADPERWQFQVLGQSYDEIGKPIDWGAAHFIPLKADAPMPTSTVDVFHYLRRNQDGFFQQLKQHAAQTDVVWMPQPWWTLRMASENIDLPAHLVPTVHDFAFDHLHWNDAFGDAYRHEVDVMVKACSKLVFSSKYTLEHAASRYGMPHERGEVIYLGDFLPETFMPTPTEAERVRAAHNLPASYFLAFHATGHKDPLTIIEAVGDLKRRAPQDFRPLVLGGIGTANLLPGTAPADPYTEKVKRRILELGLVQNQDIFALGFVPDEDVGGLYAGAAACITASRSEAGISGTLFEAFAAQTPAIFSNLPQFTERLGLDKTYGLHFEVGNAADLARAISEMLHDPEATQRRVQAAHAFFVSRTWDDIASDYLALFRRLAESGPAQRSVGPDPWFTEIASAPQELQSMTPYHSHTRASWFKYWLFEQALPLVHLTSSRRLHGTRLHAAALTDERNSLLQKNQDLLQENRQLRQEIRTLQEKYSQLELYTRIETQLYEKYRHAFTTSRHEDDDSLVISGQVRVGFKAETIQEIATRLADSGEIHRLIDFLERYYRPDSGDHNLNMLLDIYRQSLSPKLAYWDVRKTVHVVSNVLKPRTYLEVGTRTGWSLAQVFRNVPDVRAFVFDLWIPEYAGAQGSPESIRAKMAQIVGGQTEPHIEFINGNSHDTLPQFFQDKFNLRYGNRPDEFDLIVVDGDHTTLGAWWDLVDLMPRVRVGGALIFDDLDSPGEKDMQYTTSAYERDPMPENLHNLQDVWDAVAERYPNFMFLNCDTLRFQAGVALRLF